MDTKNPQLEIKDKNLRVAAVIFKARDTEHIDNIVRAIKSEDGFVCFIRDGQSSKRLYVLDRDEIQSMREGNEEESLRRAIDK